ncbi:histidine phosphatase family protein [Nocardia sp. NPDC020380]|uniref:histidine phosphatase family protein n=1 Tax=Nocardia sp. NPDC020380 TaxID=3364309 RepID=UPI0037989710
MPSTPSEPGVRQVFLARHGRTALNVGDRLRGLSNPPLDEVGIAEAKALADVLAAHHPTAVLCSPLQRAISTATAIAAAAGLEVTIDARLNDRDYGPWTGELRSEVIARFGSVDDAPGVEPLPVVAARATAAFHDIVTEYPTGPLVLVSHDAFNQPLLTALAPRLTGVRQRTACWNRIEFLDGTWQVLEVDQKPATTDRPALTRTGESPPRQG